MKLLTNKLNYIRKNYFIELLFILAAGTILLNTLFINPVIGKHDNGDFDRLMVYGGIHNLSNSYDKIYDGFLHLKYSVSPNQIFLISGEDWVSCSLVLKISTIIFLITRSFAGKLFDIRYLAFMYSIIFLIGTFLIINYKKFSKPLKITAGIYILLFFTSTCYLEYFNSFFGEPGTFVFFFLTIGTYLHLIEKEDVKKRDFIYFFIASGCFLTAKSQNIPMLPFMLIIYIALFISYKSLSFRKTIIIGSIIVTLICSASLISLTKIINENNIYQSVFSGVLRGSKTPEKDLNELGLNKRFKVFIGHSFYNTDNGLDPTGEDMLKNFYPHISNWKILFFYLKHPSRMWQKIVDAANSNYDLDKPYIGNFVKYKYSPNKKVNTFRSFLIKKFPAVHHNVYGFIIFSLIYLIISTLYLIKSNDVSIKLLNLMLIFILITGASQFILPVIGAGHGDFSKHLFLLNLSYDIMFGIALLWIVHITLRKLKIKN